MLIKHGVTETVTAEARGALVRLVFGHMAAQVVAVAARFGVADLIGDGERTAAELAEKSDAHEEQLPAVSADRILYARAQRPVQVRQAIIGWYRRVGLD
jgi:hypothetical protein